MTFFTELLLSLTKDWPTHIALGLIFVLPPSLLILTICRKLYAASFPESHGLPRSGLVSYLAGLCMLFFYLSASASLSFGVHYLWDFVFSTL